MPTDCRIRIGACARRAGSEAYAELVGRGRVHRRFYTDPAVFAEERARIFRRVWLWLGHESQLRQPGRLLHRAPGGRARHRRAPHRRRDPCLSQPLHASRRRGLPGELGQRAQLRLPVPRLDLPHRRRARLGAARAGLRRRTSSAAWTRCAWSRWRASRATADFMFGSHAAQGDDLHDLPRAGGARRLRQPGRSRARRRNRAGRRQDGAALPRQLEAAARELDRPPAPAHPAPQRDRRRRPRRPWRAAAVDRMGHRQGERPHAARMGRHADRRDAGRALLDGRLPHQGDRRESAAEALPQDHGRAPRRAAREPRSWRSTATTPSSTRTCS